VWLARPGGLGVVASWRVPETVDLGHIRAGFVRSAALTLARLPVSVRQVSMPAPIGRESLERKVPPLTFYVRLGEHERAPAHNDDSPLALALPLCRGRREDDRRRCSRMRRRHSTGSRTRSGVGRVTLSAAVWQMGVLVSDDPGRTSFSISGTTSGLSYRRCALVVGRARFHALP
jgi:hypothetical protein